MPTEDLWGDLPDGEDIRTPKTILKEQADLLIQKTDGILEGRVLTRPVDEFMRHILQIVVPSLNNYTVNILSVTQSIYGYPCYLDDFIEKGEDVYKINDEKNLMESLKHHLQSEGIQRLIKSLMAEAKAS